MYICILKNILLFALMNKCCTLKTLDNMGNIFTELRWRKKIHKNLKIVKSKP